MRRTWCTMKVCVQVVLGVILVTMLIQCALYVHSRQSIPHIVFSDSGDEVSTVPAPPSPENYTEPYPFIINRSNACGKNTELVIVVVTAVNNEEDRMAVRETWGSYAADPSGNISLVFLLGTTSSAEQQAKLVNESEKYEDIVQAGFVDSYRNLTVKSVVLLKWVTLFCNSSRFVLKVDDDMYVNVPNLLTALLEQKKDAFVMGFSFTGATPVQNKKSKWYTPIEDFDEKVYPRYTSGTAYSMTTKAAVLLYKAAKTIKLFWLEDIYITGLCARKAGVLVVHNSGFNYERLNPDGCTFRKVITGHRYTAEDKRQIHKQVHDPKLECKT